jgi:type IV pilus assembly protein PilZ
MKDVGRQFREYVRLDRLRCGAGFSPEELKRWRLLKRALGQHFSPGLSDECADQRESVRVPTRIAVSFPTEGQLAGSLMTNLSRRGVFVRTEHPLEIGTRFELRIHVDDPPQDIAIAVEVVSQNVGPSYASREPGMGLRFLDADAEAEKHLDELYERLVR